MLLWIGGAALAVAIVAGVGLTLHPELLRGHHSADTDGDGVVSDTELGEEIAAMVPFEQGQWSLNAVITKGDSPATSERPENAILDQSNVAKLISSTLTDRIAYMTTDGRWTIVQGCVIRGADLVSTDFMLVADCTNRPVDGTYHLWVTGKKSATSIESHIDRTPADPVNPRSSVTVNANRT